MMSCGNDGSGSDPACASFCERISDCGADLPECQSECDSVAAAADDVPACRTALDGLLGCLTALTCGELVQWAAGGTQCQAETTACNAACGAGECSVD